MRDEMKSKSELLKDIESLRARLVAAENKSFSTKDAVAHPVQWLMLQPQLELECDTEGKVVRATANALEYLGYAQGDVDAGLYLQQLVHPEDLRRLMINYRLLLEGKGLFGQEYRALRSDGTSFPVRTNSRRIFKDGKLTGVSIVSNDITGFINAGTTQKQSDTFFKTVLETMGTPVAVFGEDAIIRHCNARFESFCGIPRGEVENKLRWFEFVAPADRRRVEIYHSMRREDFCYAPGEYEFIFQTQGGNCKNVHLVLEMIPDTDLRICTLTDISARVLDEERRRKSSERYELVAQGANAGIWDYDLTTGSMYFSPHYQKILGYEEHEFQGTAESWRRYVHPEDHELAVSIAQDCIKGESCGFEVEYRMLHKDGTHRWIMSRGTIIRDDYGQVFRLAGTYSDITERKLNERTTNALYAISKAINATRDLQHLYQDIHSILGQYIDASNFFISLVDEEEDRLVFPYFKDEHDACYDIRAIRNRETRGLTIHVIRTGKPLFFSKDDPVWQRVLDEIGVVGTPPAVWLGVPLLLKGRIIGAMAVQHYTNPHHYTKADVAFMEAVSEQVALAIERKANEEELTRLNEKLESKVEARTAELQEKAAQLEAANIRLTELDQIKSALVSSISHELRTPLTSIRGFAKLTSKDFFRHFFPFASQPLLYEKGERIRKNLEIIESEGERLTRLISDFLDINRIESGNATWADVPLNPSRIINQAVSAVFGAFEVKEKVLLRVSLPESLPVVHADPDKLQQVLINLLDNACKFTVEGAVVVSAQTSPEFLTVSVSDTGIGIQPDEQERIFEKFHKSRMGDTTDIKDKGTGLGLAICREIIQHYGGTIWVESIPGQGSRFSFSLPVLPGTEAPSCQ